MRTLETSLNSSKKIKLYKFTNGIEIDRIFAKEEVQVQKAWAKQLLASNIFTVDENEKIQNYLSMALDEIQAGEFNWKIEDEDIHMNLESYLVEKLGDLGKKIHLGRSRNDLVATSLRLHTFSTHEKLEGILNKLISSITDLAKRHMEVIVPGMTHLQNGQPIRFSHILSSYGFRFLSDIKKIRSTKESCLEAMPLGSAAFAGTTLDIDLEDLANDLGFKGVSLNSYDSIGDRDFIVDSLHVFSLVAVHMAKICDDFIYWSSSNVALVKLPENWSTGSSIMPNKRNPDILELIRAKSSRIVSYDFEGKSILKALGSSYGSDLHELKKTFFSSYTELERCLDILIEFLSEVEVDKEKANSMLEHGHVLATDLANKLVERGSSFRDAYKMTAQENLECVNNKKQIHQGDLFSKIAPDYSFESSVEQRNLKGGTSFSQVQESLDFLLKSIMED